MKGKTSANANFHKKDEREERGFFSRALLLIFDNDDNQFEMEFQDIYFSLSKSHYYLGRLSH